jgi:hypothetical protein
MALTIKLWPSECNCSWNQLPFDIENFIGGVERATAGCERFSLLTIHAV